MIMNKHIIARLKQAQMLSELSACPRGKVGAVIFEPNSWVIISDGYNGPPRGGGHLCGGDLCERDARQIISGTMTEVGCHHAESNAIINAARRGSSTLGAWLAVSRTPCLNCAKAIHHAGIERVYVITEQRALDCVGAEYLKEHGVEVTRWSEKRRHIKNDV
jgi:dCMP deaminase